MASTNETGVTFFVRQASDGAAVFAGSVGSPVGSWSAGFPHVYRLDFDALGAPGTYTLTVGGPAPASSPPFTIGPARTLYAGLLANALSYYQNSRDGPGFIRSPLRSAPAHLNDRHARTYLTPRVNADGGFTGDLPPVPRRIDASGGW